MLVTKLPFWYRLMVTPARGVSSELKLSPVMSVNLVPVMVTCLKLAKLLPVAVPPLWTPVPPTVTVSSELKLSPVMSVNLVPVMVTCLKLAKLLPVAVPPL